ncbi:hypothetical protein [Methylobacterium sp. UNC378MF]|uniref:hypothetical protein n=1 Tax=Methylobacterium sp. UNC378MF TaxID=1502748 RepID=UPI000B886EEA|nr:hypothetical protein [Methylobacterium sp. UNC378MF]
MQPKPAPLPESLTRLLATPERRSAGAQKAPPPRDGALRPPDRCSAHAALETAILRAFVFGLSALLRIVVLVLSVRHVMR